jgi:hypothetical protein
VSVDRGADRYQYVVSFDNGGRYTSHVEVDAWEMAVGHLEILPSGNYFVRANRAGVGPRLAVLGPRGDWHHDVMLLGEPDRQDGRPRQDRVALGSDGRIYVVPEESSVVHVIEEAGESRRAFELSPVVPNGRLVGLKAAGDRLMALYAEVHGKAVGGPVWIALYDTTLGTRRALYGPVDALPVCYSVREGREEFKLLRGARLVTMSP